MFKNLPGHFTLLVPGSVVAEVAPNFKVFPIVKTGSPCQRGTWTPLSMFYIMLHSTLKFS